MSKKVKTLSPENAGKLLDMIEKFGTPGEKGRHDRASFQGIVDFGLRTHASTREELTSRAGLRNEYFSLASKGAAPTVSSGTRSSVFNIFREKIAGVVAPAPAAK